MRTELSTPNQGAGIALRPAVIADAPAIVAAVHESLDDLLPWMGWVTRGFDEEQAASWIASQEAAGDFRDGAAFLIVDEDDRVLGACGINQVNVANRFANLGYWVRSSAAGRGVAVEAVRQLVDWVFAHTDLERLELVVSVGNSRSERVAEKAGAVREGALRSRVLVHGVFHDATMYGIVRGTGSARRPALHREE